MHRLAIAGGMLLVAGCGGTASGDLDESQVGGAAGSTSSGGASGTPGTGGSSPGTGGTGGGSQGTGGTSQGTGGGSQGTGGTSGGIPGYANCVSTCRTLADQICPANKFNESECLDQCDKLGSRGPACETAFVDAYACFVREVPVRCGDNGDAVIVCGPCNDELQAVATSCKETEIRCSF